MLEAVGLFGIGVCIGILSIIAEKVFGFKLPF